MERFGGSVTAGLTGVGIKCVLVCIMCVRMRMYMCVCVCVFHMYSVHDVHTYICIGRGCRERRNYIGVCLCVG